MTKELRKNGTLSTSWELRMKNLLIVMLVLSPSLAANAKPSLECVCSFYSPATQPNGDETALVHSRIATSEDAVLTTEGLERVTKYLGDRDVNVLVSRKQLDAQQVQRLGSECKKIENETLFGCRLMIRSN
jgi:hypothetical protein